MDTLARAGGQMRGAATKAMSDIAEERQQRRYAPFAAAPLRAAARRAAGRSSRWLCCSLLTYGLGIARRSRLASGPGGLQQNVKLFLREPLSTHGHKYGNVLPRLGWKLFHPEGWEEISQG